MSESDGARGIEPDYIARIYEGPLKAAQLSVDLARLGLEGVGSEPETPQDHAITETRLMHLASTEKQQASLRDTGRAALYEIDDFPPEAILRAQMKMDLRPAEEADAFFAHVDALNEYARRAEHPAIAIVNRTALDPGMDVGGTVRFLAPSESEKDGDRPTVELERRGKEHHLNFQVGRAHMIGFSDDTPISSDALDRPTAIMVEATPAADIVFAADSGAVEKLLDEEPDMDTPVHQPARHLPAIVVYGEEAVDKLVDSLASEHQSLRPTLYGAMKYMGRSYNGPALEGETAISEAREYFSSELSHYLNVAIATGGSIISGTGDRFPTINPDVQAFIGFRDEKVISFVEEFVGGWSFAGKDAIVQSGGSNKPVSEVWAEVWGDLKNLGFTRLADRMMQPTQAAYSVANIERQALLRALEKDAQDTSGSSQRMTRRQRRGVKAAIRATESRLEALEQ